MSLISLLHESHLPPFSQFNEHSVIMSQAGFPSTNNFNRMAGVGWEWPSHMEVVFVLICRGFFSRVYSWFSKPFRPADPPAEEPAAPEEEVNVL